MVVRVYYLTIQSHNYYEALSNKNSVKSETILPIRGLIYDRNHNPIAINKLGFKIAIKPHLGGKQYREQLNNEIDYIHSLLPQLSKE